LRDLCCQAHSRTLDPGLTHGGKHDDVSFSLLRIRSDDNNDYMSFSLLRIRSGGELAYPDLLCWDSKIKGFMRSDSMWQMKIGPITLSETVYASFFLLISIGPLLRTARKWLHDTCQPMIGLASHKVSFHI